MGWRERISTAASRRDATCSKLKRIPRGDARFPIPWDVVGGHAGEGVLEEKATAEVRFLGKTEQHAYAQNNNQKHSLDHSVLKINVLMQCISEQIFKSDHLLEDAAMCIGLQADCGDKCQMYGLLK